MFYFPTRAAGTTYYWRIDEREPNDNIVTGDLWSFSTAPLKAINPDPADGALWVDLNLAQVSWIAGWDSTSYDVYFGTDEANLPLVADDDSGNIYNPGVMDAGITYYWKVDANVAGEITPGPLWWFKAGEPGEELVWVGTGGDDLWCSWENWNVQPSL